MLGSVTFSDDRSFRLHLAVLQPTPFCNIDCKYCYLPDRQQFHKMSFEVLEQTYRFIFSNPARLRQHIAVAWHVGEPLAIPVSYYEQAFAMQRTFVPPEIEVANWFQTNGTLITQQWCDFFKRWDIKVGVSLDGPEAVHNLNRIDRSGRGTYDKVIRGVELLQKNRIEFDIFAVVPEQSLPYPEELWKFFKGIGSTAIALCLEEAKGNHLCSTLQGGHTVSQVREFMDSLLRLRDAEDPKIHIREIDYFIDGIPSWVGGFRLDENVPLCITSIMWNGDVSMFSPELSGIKNVRYGNFVFGNVATDTMDSILKSPKFLRVRDEIEAGVARCKQICPYFCMCGGGSPAHKITEHGTFDATETAACRQRIKTIGDLMVARLEAKYGVNDAGLKPMQERIATLAHRMECDSANEPGGRFNRCRALDVPERLHPYSNPLDASLDIQSISSLS